MKPNSEFRERLFIAAGGNSDRIQEFSCDHIIPAENILPIILTEGPKNNQLSFNYENRLSMVTHSSKIIFLINGTFLGRQPEKHPARGLQTS